MASDQRDASQELEAEELAVEVAKLKVRLAAEKAEPGRLLRDGIRSAPWSSVVGAIGAGALLALTRRWRKPGAAATLTGAPRRSEPTDANPRGGLAALAIALGLEMARSRFPELFSRVPEASTD